MSSSSSSSHPPPSSPSHSGAVSENEMEDDNNHKGKNNKGGKEKEKEKDKDFDDNDNDDGGKDDAITMETTIELPLACVNRIIRSCIPANFQLQKDVRSALAKAGGIFVLYLIHVANEFANAAGRGTINSNDVLSALEEMDFEALLPSLQNFLTEYQKEMHELKKKAKQKATGAGGGEENTSSSSSNNNTTNNNGPPPVLRGFARTKAQGGQLPVPKKLQEARAKAAAKRTATTDDETKKGKGEREGDGDAENTKKQRISGGEGKGDDMMDDSIEDNN